MSVCVRACVPLATRLRGLAVLLGAVAWFANDSGIATAGQGAQKLVVVLYPNASDGAPGIYLTDLAIRSTFASESAETIEIRNEYVDTSRLRDSDFKQAQVTFLRRKYAGQKVDLVIAVLSSALDFALNHRDELFTGVPVVYVAVDQREVKARRLPSDVIGVPVWMDMAGTLDLALQLHPGSRRVFVIAGSAPLDTYWEAEARRTFRPYQDRLEFTYLTGIPMDEMIARAADLPEQSLVYYLHTFQDGAGKTFIPADALDLIAARSNSPIYGHVGTYIGRGVVGGRVFSFDTEGRNAARLGLRILAGEKPEAIPLPEVSENTNLFDWRQLRRWDINESLLPSDSIVRFRESTFWSENKWYILGAILLCTIQSLLVAGLLVQWVKRKGADRRFGQVVESTLTGMLLVGRDGTIVLVNAQVVKLFGYAKNELMGLSVEALIPDRFRDTHPGHRTRFFASPDARSMGSGRDLFARRKDGTEFPVEIGLSPVSTARGLFVLASVIDITERRRAEDDLRASRQELQRLTGRLLVAQELERRRIARELHDDLNQSLALLSVEMDLLGELPSQSPAQMSERVRALSARVKALSSVVHDLSHQLHPSKLEHLGLVAAIRALCKELAQAHSLNVRFIHNDVPPTVSEAVALCLYRIAQEALRNAIKHSGASHVVVELSGTAGGIRLQVTDDGIGFEPRTGSAAGGLGLLSMRERLYLVGGEITIDSGPSAGTRIDVRVPATADGTEGATLTHAAE